MDAFLDKLLQVGQFFAFVFAELVVLFIGISFLVGILNEFITPDKAQRWLSSSKGRGYFIGAGLGALTPFCSCSTIPIMLGLLKARAGFGPTMTFLISSPLLNPVIVILFFAAIGLAKTLLYMIIAISMAIIAGLILEKLGYLKQVDPKALSGGVHTACCDKETSPASAPVQIQPAPFAMASLEATPLSPAEATACCGSSGTGPIDSGQSQPKRWKRIFAEAVGQFRKFLPYVIIGVAIGAIAHGFVPKDLVVKWAGPDNAFAVPVAAVIGVPLYIRASTMIPIAMSLLAKGLSMGAMMALVIGGAGASLPELVILKRLFKMPLLIAFLVVIFSMAVVTGLVFNLLA
jgi:uncharacterized membrane protein YraQ (UPF0718 family)